MYVVMQMDKIKALLKDKETQENDQHKAEEIIQK